MIIANNKYFSRILKTLFLGLIMIIVVVFDCCCDDDDCNNDVDVVDDWIRPMAIIRIEFECFFRN